MKHPRFSKNKRSFTLIEQVVVLAITAILAVVAIPAVNNANGSMKVGRAAELVKEDMEFMGPVRVADVEKAQQEIVEVVRRLEEAGELIIAGRGGEEEIIE